MTKLGSYTPRDKVDVPDNLYYAQIKKIELKKWSEENITFNWTFEIVQPPFLGKRVWVWGTTGTIPSAKARITAWGSVLGYSREQLADKDFDTEVLVGSYVKILLKTWEKESGGTKQGVTDLLPMTDVDTQILQGFLAQLQVTGQVKVATQSAPVEQPVQPVVVQPPTVTHTPVTITAAPAQPVVPSVQQPATVVPAPVAPKRTSSFPF